MLDRGLVLIFQSLDFEGEAVAELVDQDDLFGGAALANGAVGQLDLDGWLVLRVELALSLSLRCV